jgi:hypothetical protein
MKNIKSFALILLTLGILAACSSAEPAVIIENDTADQVAINDGAAIGDESGVMEKDDGTADHDDSVMEDAAEVMDDDASTMDEDGPAEGDMDDMAESMDDDADAMDEDGPAEDDLEADDSMMEEVMDDSGSAADAGESMDTMEEMDETDGAAEVMALPAWQQIALTNARTGELFMLSDFAGKTVFVEPMATWCTKCLQQLTNVRQAQGQLNGDDTVLVALSLETNLSDQVLAQYADGRGFNWLFAVMTPEILGELADEFGRVITSAPSTPHFIIRPDGSFTSLTTGIESSEQILGQLQAARG